MGSKSHLTSLLLLVSVALFSTFAVTGLLTTSRTVVSSGTVKAINIEIYRDIECTQVVNEIQWGVIEPGASVTETVYIKNTGNAPLTLSMSSSGWDPGEAGVLITLAWDREGETIDPEVVVGATLTLSVSNPISSFTTFSFNIVIEGTGTDAPQPQASTVGRGISASIRTPIQRQTFYAKGLHWVFYFYNMAIRYRVSPDGLVWSELFLVTGTGYGDFFSLHFDGSYLHYVCTSWGPRIWYRRGIPNSNGTISWSAEEQDIPVLKEFYSTDPTITVDSEGYPWVGCYGENMEPIICKSDQNDGTWTSNAPGFPYSLNPERRYYGVIPVPLTSGKVYAIYLRSYKKEQLYSLPTAPIYGRLWEGVAWGEEEEVSSSNVANTDFHLASALASGDDVHVAFLKDSTYDIIHVKRTWGVGWSPEQVIQPSASDLSSPVLSYSRTRETPYCFWAQNDRIYYKTYADNMWGEFVEWVLEGEPVKANDLICFYEDYGSKIGVVWYLPSGFLRYNHLITSK